MCHCMCGVERSRRLRTLMKSAEMRDFVLAFGISSVLLLSCNAQTAPQPNPDDMKRYWQALVPSLPSVLKESFPDCCVEPKYSPDWNGYYPVRIIQTGDVTGD